MRINPVSYSTYNFKGIKLLNKDDEPVINKMLGYKRELYNQITDEKGIDIFLFGKVTKGDGTSVPAYAGIIQEKNDRINENGKVKSVASFKCFMTDEGLKEARNKVETAVIWANAPANLMALGAISDYGRTKDEQDYVNKLQDKMIAAKTNLESKVWREKLQMLLTNQSDEI